METLYLYVNGKPQSTSTYLQ